jgi:hypothetical protein
MSFHLTWTPHRLAHTKQLLGTGTRHNEAIRIHVWNQGRPNEIAREKVGFIVLISKTIKFCDDEAKSEISTSPRPAMTGSIK